MRTRHSCSEMAPVQCSCYNDLSCLFQVPVPTFLKAPLTKVLMSAVLPTPLPPSTRTLQEAMPRLLSTALLTMAPTLSPSCLRHHRRPDTHWNRCGNTGHGKLLRWWDAVQCKVRCVIWSGAIKL